MARTAPGEATIRKDRDDEEVTPEALDELAARANELSGDGEDDEDPADEIIELDDEDGDDDDDGEGDDGDGSEDVGGNFDADADDDDDDEDDSDDDDEEDDDDDAEDEDDDDEDDDLDDDSEDDEDDDTMAKDMTADAPKKVVDEDEIEETQPEDGDGKKKNEKEQTKKSSDLALDLRRAIDAMVRHGQKSDPSVRKEALMAKELHGGGLSESERGELAKMLIGGPRTSKLQKAIYEVQTPNDTVQKSMVSNEVMGLAFDGVTKSLLAQAEHLEGSCQNLEATQHLMAKTLVKIGESVVKMLDGQQQVGRQLSKFNRTPVSAPRSVGVDWARKSLAGARVDEDQGQQAPAAEPSRPASFRRLAKSSPNRIDEALVALTKSVGAQTEMGRAYASARDAIAIQRPLMPMVAAKVEEYLADH